MTFDEVLSQVQALLQRDQWVSYRSLKRRFALDDEYLADLKEELLGAKRLATDEDGRFLVWVRESEERKAKSEERGKVELKELSVASRLSTGGCDMAWLGKGSRVSREAHARLCERLRGQFPWPTHQLVAT